MIKLGRRQFALTGSSGLALTACSPRITPRAASPLAFDAKRSSLLERALAVAKRLGASYADVRIVSRRFERIEVREERVTRVEDAESLGLGLRVLVGGAWGFAATPDLSENQADDVAARAVALAKAGARLLTTRATLAAEPSARARYATPMRIDPFDVPLGEKVEYLLSLWREARAVSGVKFAVGTIDSDRESKLFASSDGSLIEQTITRIAPGFEVTAVGSKGGASQTRAHDIAPFQGGWELLTGSALRAEARKTGEEAAEKLTAARIDEGKRDLILTPSNLFLTIHETVGHSTELDRVFGYEANYAGTSFATTDKLGKLQFGAKELSFYADRTTPRGLATCDYDDEGVKTQRWNLVQNGVLVGYQTTRDLAHLIGESRSRGTLYGQDFRSVPFSRMPNISLAPAKAARSLADIIAATDSAILIVGDGSWSIDQQRYNFQFGGQMFYEIKAGKVERTLRDVAYQSTTTEFWNSCDLIGGEQSWELHGLVNDGKGEPFQSNAVSHGCPPARFRNVRVLPSTRA